MLRCAFCNGEIREDMAFCPYCGQPVEPVPEEDGMPRRGGFWNIEGHTFRGNLSQEAHEEHD